MNRRSNFSDSRTGRSYAGPTQLCANSSDEHALRDVRMMLRDYQIGDKHQVCRRNMKTVDTVMSPDIPDHFIDPVTMDIMHDVVTIGPHSFDRSTAARLKLVNGSYKNPLDRQEYAVIYKNIGLQKALDEWKKYSGYFTADQLPDVDSNPTVMDDEYRIAYAAASVASAARTALAVIYEENDDDDDTDAVRVLELPMGWSNVPDVDLLSIVQELHIVERNEDDLVTSRLVVGRTEDNHVSIEFNCRGGGNFHIYRMLVPGYEIVEDINRLINGHYQLYDIFSSIWRTNLFVRAIRGFILTRSKTRVTINMGIETMVWTCYIVGNEPWSAEESMLETESFDLLDNASELMFNASMRRICKRLVEDYRSVHLDILQIPILAATISLIASMTR
jgi:hypothetical protein